jgi:predicted DNA-binding transcriptional regulator
MKRFDAAALIAAMHGKRDYSCPKGWYTIEQIRQELNLAYPRNASSRAYQLHRNGLLERQAHQFKADTGQCHLAYVYRPRPPFKTMKQAAESNFTAREEKVPKGFVRIVDFAFDVGISHVAIRARVARAGLKASYFKTARGMSGLHLNAFYRKADLDRLIRKAS